MGNSFKILSFLLLSNILSISTATRTIEPDCGSCTKPPIVPIGGSPNPPVIIPKVPVPPVTGIIPPVTVPKVPVPPVTGIIPPVTVPKIPVPPVTGIIPPVTVPKLPVPPVIGVVPLLPPVTVPPVTVTIPPVITVPELPIIGALPLPPVTMLPPAASTTPCAPPAPEMATCPVDTLKLGACASVLGGVASISMGDDVVNECCPIISGLMDVEAAACLCTTLKLKVLNMEIYVPIALQLLITCGKTPPPGYTCAST